MKPSHPTPEKAGNKLARGNLDCTSLLEWFYFLCSLKKASVQLWYSPGKGLVGRAVAACPREVLPEKAAMSNSSKQNNLKQKANRVICSGSFFSWCSTPKIQLFSHRDVNNRSDNKIMLGDDEAPQQGLWRKSQSCLKGVLWEGQLLESFLLPGLTKAFPVVIFSSPEHYLR